MNATASDATVTTSAPAPAAAPAPMTPEQLALRAEAEARANLAHGIVENAKANADAIRKAEAIAIDATSTRGFNESLAVAKLYNLPLAFLRNWRPARSNSKDVCPEELAIRDIHNNLRPSDGPQRVAEIMETVRAAVSCVPEQATEQARVVSQVVSKPSVSATDKKAAFKTVEEARTAFDAAIAKLGSDDERDAWAGAMLAADSGDYAPLNKLLSDAGNFASKAKTTSRRWRAALILPYIATDIRDAGDIGANWQPASEKALKALQDLVTETLEKTKAAPSEEDCRDAMHKAARDYLGLSDGGEPIDPEEVKAKRLANAVSVIFNKLKYLADNGGLSAEGRAAIELKCREHGLIPTAKDAAKSEEDAATDPAAAALAAQENAAAKVEAPAPAPVATTGDAAAAAAVVSAVSDAPVTSPAPAETDADRIAKARAAMEASAAPVAPKSKAAAKASKLARK